MSKRQNSIAFKPRKLSLYLSFLLLALLPLATIFSVEANESPPIQLATQFREDIDITVLIGTATI